MILSRIHGFTDLAEACAGCALVVEAVYEDMQVKTEVFSRMDSACAPDAVLASNTSTLSITALGAATKRPERVLGTHFLYPAPAIPLVEVVRGQRTSEETLQRTLEFLALLGKQVVVVNDYPGFAINLLFIPFINEAFLALQEGVATAQDIDRACKVGLAHPSGPLTAADAFGLDIVLAVMKVLHGELGDKYRSHHRSSPRQDAAYPHPCLRRGRGRQENHSNAAVGQRYHLPAGRQASRHIAAAVCAFRQTQNTSDATQPNKPLMFLSDLPARQAGNDSEFKGAFDKALQHLGFPHYRTYPKSPKMNAHCERFNRTIQEGFVDFHEDLLFIDIELFNQKLAQWLITYNTLVPHHSLQLRSPVDWLLYHHPECQRYWTNTLG